MSSNKKGTGKQKQLRGSSTRDGRLAEALRTNLARRKEQGRRRQEALDVVKTAKI